VNTNDLTNRLNHAYATMSKGQKALAAYISDNYDKAVFLTAAKLGEIVGVSESTVVRFAASLGYKGYPEFQKALEEMVQQKLENSTKPQLTPGRYKQSKLLETAVKTDIENLKETLDMLDSEAFELAVDSIVKAKHVYVVGIRSCAPLASYFAYELHLIRQNISLIQTNNISELFEQLLHISSEDVIFGISFPRYSMRTLKAMEFANDRNATVITLTDSIHSPMNLYSSCNLLAASHMNGLVESMAAPMSILNALITALQRKLPENVRKNLDELEHIWDNYQFEGNDDMSLATDAMKAQYKVVGE
jgi:DNA-binding MurR/RpiR family transcriptional regulator